MNKKYVLMILFLLAEFSFAQVTTYNFSTSSGSYSAIVGGTVLGTGNTLDDNNFTNLPLGFTFVFDGSTYTVCSANSNGFIWIGNGTPQLNSYNPISGINSGNVNGIMSPLGRDLQGNTANGELRYQTLGSSPNRIFVIQWKGMRKYNVAGDDFNFQIRLYEGTNVIDFIYGSFTVNATSSTAQVGIRGNTNADYNNRQTTTNWSATTAGTLNTSSCTLAGGVKPTSGATFTWTPSSSTALSGDFPVGLAMFNRITGKNLYHKTFTRVVEREVTTEKDNITKEEASEQNTISIKNPNVNTVLKQVTEEYSVIMDNGEPYNGPSFVKISENLAQQFGIPNPGTDAGVYTTVTAAVNDLNTRGVSGAVRFLLVDATYPSETFPISVNSVPGISATNTFTIKPFTGITATISGSINNNVILKVFNTSYVTIDGSNTSGGTTRDLTITNTNAGTPFVLALTSSGTTTFTDNVLKNCIIINGSINASAVIISDGTTLGNAGYFNNVTIQNNSIQKAYIGIYGTGGTTPQHGTNLSYIGNDLTTSGANAMGYVGLYSQGVNGLLVSGNQAANFISTVARDDKGMWMASGTINATIEKNRIYNLSNTTGAGYGAHGIYLTPGLANANFEIRNNMIANLTGDGWNYTSAFVLDNPIGIVIPAFVQTGFRIYNNSIYLNGNTLNQTNAMSMGIIIGNNASADIRNNLIVNNLGLLGVTGYGASGIYAQTSNAQFIDINYNDYVVNPTGGGVKAFGQIAASSSTTIPQWRTATGKDLKSFTSVPSFTSATDLHINTTNLAISGRGAYIGTITEDYDGNVRTTSASSVLKPVDVGADQYTPGASPTGNTNNSSGAFYLDGEVSTLEIVSGSFTTTGVRSYPGVKTQYNTLLRPTIWNYWQVDNLVLTSIPTIVRFYYTDEQMAGITETNLQFSWYNLSSGAWENLFIQTQNTALNYIDVELSSLAVNFGGIATFAIGDKTNPLPIELLSFTGVVRSRDISLNWTTAWEINNRGFEIQRRDKIGINNYTDWKILGFINGNGTTNEPKDYTFTDRQLGTGTYQYRLKQFDFNGNSAFFNLNTPVSDLVVGKPINFELSQSYPNPSNPKSKIDYQIPFNGIVSLKVYDLTGREVKTLINGYKEAGFYTTEFDGNDLSSGVYFYRIDAQGDGQKFTKTLKLILVK